ncbi:MAG TPA: hypothetical protein VGH73_21225 [Thermoanaerobaculia bacterium]|jgi:N-acetylmuramoyl-L-alanine amidase
MKRNVILCAVAAALLSAVAVWAAPPFGSFGGIVGGGNAGAGLMPLTGWALDDNGIQAVDILVDGLVAGRATLGRARAGVTARFPGYPDSPGPGFAFQLDTTHYLNGLHTVAARVRSRAGEVVVLPPQTIYFNNVESNLQPFGQIEFPQPQAEMRGKCNADRNRRFSVVSGYALDAGTTPTDTGIGYVELLIDRSFFANSQTDCSYSALTGGYTDCYGIRRVDIERIFPGLKDSPHSGFRFVIDVGDLIASGYLNQGQHVLTIRAGDLASQTKDIAEFPVTFSCDDNLPNEASFGNIDLPARGLLYNGVVPATGWVLDWEGVASVQILVDGHPFGFANYGFARPDVFELSYYPGYPNVAAPGWQFPLDTRVLSNGEHFIDVLVTDSLGATTYIGKKRFVVNNVGG